MIASAAMRLISAPGRGRLAGRSQNALEPAAQKGDDTGEGRCRRRDVGDPGRLDVLFHQPQFQRQQGIDRHGLQIACRRQQKKDQQKAREGDQAAAHVAGGIGDERAAERPADDDSKLEQEQPFRQRERPRADKVVGEGADAEPCEGRVEQARHEAAAEQIERTGVGQDGEPGGGEHHAADEDEIGAQPAQDHRDHVEQALAATRQQVVGEIAQMRDGRRILHLAGRGKGERRGRSLSRTCDMQAETDEPI